MRSRWALPESFGLDRTFEMMEFNRSPARVPENLMFNPPGMGTRHTLCSHPRSQKDWGSLCRELILRTQTLGMNDPALVIKAKSFLIVLAKIFRCKKTRIYLEAQRRVLPERGQRER